MEMSGETKATIVIFVILMIGGTLGIYGMSILMHEDTPYEQSRAYTVSGTIDGVQYEGGGTAVYTPENSNYHTYAYSFELSDSEGNNRDTSFGMVFLSDGSPDPSIYTYSGESEVDGTAVTVWASSAENIDYTYYVSDCCYVLLVTIESDEMSLIAVMTSPQYS